VKRKAEYAIRKFTDVRAEVSRLRAKMRERGRKKKMMRKASGKNQRSGRENADR